MSGGYKQPCACGERNNTKLREIGGVQYRMCEECYADIADWYSELWQEQQANARQAVNAALLYARSPAWAERED